MPGQPLEQSPHLLDDRGDVHDPGREELAAREGEQLGGERRGSLRRVADLAQVGGGRVAVPDPPAEQLGVAEDAGEEVVEVVSDAAGEPADRLEPLRLVKLALHVPDVRDVGQAPDPVGAPVGEGNGPVEDVAVAAVSGAEAVLGDVLGTPGGRFVVEPVDPITVIGVYAVEPPVVAGLDLRGRVAEHARHAAGPEAVVCAEVPLVDRDVERLGCELEPAGRAAERLLGLARPRDVLDQGEADAGAARRVAHERDDQVSPRELAVLADVAFGQLVAVAPAVEQLLPERGVRRHVVGVGVVGEAQRADLLAAVADEVLERAVGLDGSPFEVDQADSDLSLVENRPQLPLGLLELALRPQPVELRAGAGGEDAQDRLGGRVVPERLVVEDGNEPHTLAGR